MNEQYEIMQGK